MKNIRDEIVENRRRRIATEGHALGHGLPVVREVLPIPFPGNPPLICEIKRRSPSRGAINEELDPVATAGRYLAKGVTSVSVLTEEDHFSGSLADLMRIKEAHPGLAVLRKDFLLDIEDINITYRAGADAVLLIAAVLSQPDLEDMYAATMKLGMTALVELHDEADVEKARSFQPELVGINARNLADFTVDLLDPLRLHKFVDWDHSCVFESGIFTEGHTRFLTASGFDAALVGEAVVRQPDSIPGLIRGLSRPADGSKPGDRPDVQYRHPTGDFWIRLTARQKSHAPLVKVCGITNVADAELAVRLGADVLGFVFADSPRKAAPALLEELADLRVLKAAIVVSGQRHGPLDPIVGDLLSSGLIDVIQFHGDESPESCTQTAFPYYRALRPAVPGDAQQIREYDCPRVLVDARSESAYGGTGRLLSPDLVEAAAEFAPLWLAGGLNDNNISDTVRRYRPELVDVSSGLEGSPGKKDPTRLERFFKEIKYV